MPKEPVAQVNSIHRIFNHSSENLVKLKLLKYYFTKHSAIRGTLTQNRHSNLKNKNTQ